MNLFAATSYAHVIPFLIFNWIWVGWCALELPGSKKYGIQSVVVLLLIFFFSIFQYFNFVITCILIIYTFEKWKYFRKNPTEKHGGHIENALKSLIRNYDGDRRNQGPK